MNKEDLVQLVIEKVIASIQEKELNTPFQDIAKPTFCPNFNYLELDLNCAADLDDKKSTSNSIYLKNLSLNALAEIALGFTTKPATAFLRQAILQGKKLYTTADQIELYAYKENINPHYYKKFKEHLEFLQKSGLNILESVEQLDAMINGETQSPNNYSSKQFTSLVFDKKVLTEQIIADFRKEHQVHELIIAEKTIVTALAKEYAMKYSICITRCKNIQL